MRTSDKKRIGIDARFYGPVGKGLGRYTQELVDNLIRLDSENEYVIFLGKENFNELECDGKRVRKALVDVRWYTLAEQLVLPWRIWREGLDLVHFPHFNVPLLCPKRFVVTIHDLILLNYPTERTTTLGPLVYKIKNLAYRLVIWQAVRRSKKIFAVSQFTKDDVVKYFGVPEAKVIVTYEGVANLAKGRVGLFDRSDAPGKLFARLNITKPYLLYVGNAYPHKNLEGLLKVFKKLHVVNPELQLVLVGKEDYFYERLKKLAREFDLWREDEPSPVIFTGYVSDPELEQLFSNGLAYVFPSFFEGFGLPPLEAMAKGLPVVSSSKTSLPEVLGQAALYFDPDDEADVLAKLKTITGDRELRERLITAGREQVKKYSWWECARDTLENYRKILAN